MKEMLQRNGAKKKTGKVVWIFTCQIAKLRCSFSKIEVPMID